MRWRVAGLLLFSALMGCTRLSGLPPAHPSPAHSSRPSSPAFSVHPFPSAASPSPLVSVQAGAVQAVVPTSWEARPLPEARFPHRGFMASPRIAEWERAAGTVRGMEIYWIDVSDARIPSDFYYLVARGPVVGFLAANRSCRAASLRVLADHPPELTGRRFSPGDFAAWARGTCRVDDRRTHWAYIVAAPGFGPAREVGIPTSGLYVVVAVVSGGRSGELLDQMIEHARFGNASITQILDRARGAQ